MLFLDTGFFKGMMDDKDIHHKEALEIKEYIENSKEHTVINTTVLVETLNWSKGAQDELEVLYNDLTSGNDYISLTEDDYYESLTINEWYGRSINFSDCTIIKTMLDLKITQIVTFDNDFKNAGFKTVSNVQGGVLNGFSL